LESEGGSKHTQIENQSEPLPGLAYSMLLLTHYDHPVTRWGHAISESGSSALLAMLCGNRITAQLAHAQAL